MTVSPPAADEFFEIGACVQILVVRRQIVKELGRSVDTCRCKTNPSIGWKVCLAMPFRKLVVSCSEQYRRPQPMN